MIDPGIRTSRSALVLLGSLVALGGCPSDDTGGSATQASASSGDTTSASQTNTSVSNDTEDPVGWFEIGWGQADFLPIADGDDFPIVVGGQGAQMFPVPFRGGEFFLPGNPTSWMDETGPLVDFEMDIEGRNDGPGGHFKRIANYTLDWVVLPDGTYQSSFLAVIVPDGIDASEIEGEPAHLWVRLRPHDQPALELELDVVVTVSAEFGG